jgi:hypothetical protein
LRTDILQGEPSVPAGAYLYSAPIDMPAIANSDFLFTPEPCSLTLILGGVVMGLIRRR